MADKKTNREKLKEITDSIEQGIKELFQSDKYAEYLRTMSKFHSYSVRNTILIHMQRPPRPSRRRSRKKSWTR